jgi:hypothetical protein
MMMMKYRKILFAGLLLASFSFSSCGKKAMDIQVSELETACDFVDAMELVIDETAALVDGVTSKDALSSSQTTELEALTTKLQEISEAAEAKYTKAEAQECKNFERLREKGEKLESLF